VQNFSKFLSPGIPQTQLKTTQANHVLPPRGTPEFREIKDKETYEVTPSGNAVVIEEQLMNVTETQGDYRLVTNLYQKHLKMIRAAIGADRR
jgi:flagellar basal-body rod protein FlgB